jgi:hypothetical protein
MKLVAALPEGAERDGWELALLWRLKVAIQRFARRRR